MKKFITALATLFLGLQVSAKTVFVEKATSEEVDKGSNSTINELVRAAVPQVDGYTLTDEAKGADFILRPKLNKLGNSYFLAIDKIAKDKSVYSANMKAATIEDMDVVALRVVRAALLEVKTKDSATTADVTKEEETQGTRRFQATRQWKFGFGPAWSKNLNATEGTAWDLGFVWGLDPYFDLYLDWGFFVAKDSGGSGAGFTNLNLGMNYFFDLFKNSPYVTANIGKGAAHAADGSIFSNDDASGWTLGLGAGYKFFRTSSVNMGLGLNHYLMFDKTAKTDKNPGLTTFAVSVYY